MTATHSFSIAPATPSERRAAFRLAFGHLAPADINAKLRHAEEMIRSGELDPDGVWLAQDDVGAAAAMIAAPVPGGGAVVWPPRARPSLAEPERLIDALANRVLVWLRARPVKLAQAIYPPADDAAGAHLLRSGFRQVTRLVYLRRFLDLSYAELADPGTLRFAAFDTVNGSIVESTLAATYGNTLDCPELNGLRTPSEVLAGHRGAGAEFDPGRWMLAFDGDEPAGILLLNQPEPTEWDLAYLGIVPAFRRRGFGRQLVRKALFEAKAAGMMMVTLSVDERNQPARALYRRCGFEQFDERTVLLATFGE